MHDSHCLRQDQSPASPAAFFARSADMDTWPEWNTDTEWVRLDGEFAQGATGTLKPKGGPEVGFVVERLVPGREFVDVSKLFGARLTFAHLVNERSDGGSDVEVTSTMTGPLARLWLLVLGAGIRKGMPADLQALSRAAVAARLQPE